MTTRYFVGLGVGLEVLGKKESRTTIPEYQGKSEGAKRFLQNILELAEKGNIDNAYAALKKVNLFNFAALETDDTKVDNAPPPEVSESLPAVDIAAAQVKETKPEEESPEEESPEEESPEEESPEEESPEEESPEEESPEEESPEKESPEKESPEKESLEQQERSAIRRRAKERRLPAGESVVELKKQKIH